MAVTPDEALAHAQTFRTNLLIAAGAELDDKRSCYELATHVHLLDTRHKHQALLQSACQVIDDLLLAFSPPKENPP
jgi:hypothetical protein